MVKNLPTNAGDVGLIPDQGGSHVQQRGWACALQLLSQCSGAREPQLLNSCAAITEAYELWSPCSPTGGATMVRGLHTTRE